MLRFLFGYLLSPRLSARATAKAQRPQPRLEAMEDRITPSPLVRPAQGNDNAVSSADPSPAVSQGSQDSSYSAGAGQAGPVRASPEAENSISATANKDLVFQNLRGGNNGVPTDVSRDLVFEELNDSFYLVWVLWPQDTLSQTSDSLSGLLTYGDLLEAMEMGMAQDSDILS